MRHLLFGAVLASLFPACAPAAAHAILLESQPAVRATVAPGPARIVLRFNSRIELRGGPAPLPLQTAPGPTPDLLVADTTLAPGPWVLRWQVLAVDGHITRGEVPITVTGPTPGGH